MNSGRQFYLQTFLLCLLPAAFYALFICAATGGRKIWGVLPLLFLLHAALNFLVAVTFYKKSLAQKSSQAMIIPTGMFWGTMFFLLVTLAGFFFSNRVATKLLSYISKSVHDNWMLAWLLPAAGLQILLLALLRKISGPADTETEKRAFPRKVAFGFLVPFALIGALVLALKDPDKMPVPANPHKRHMTDRQIMRSMHENAQREEKKACREISDLYSLQETGDMRQDAMRMRCIDYARHDPEQAKDCGLPSAEGMTVVYITAQRGTSLSSHSLGAQTGTTRTASIGVMHGNKEFYVVAENYQPVIWQLEGETARIRQLVLTGAGPAGVTGIDAERVRFAGPECSLPRPQNTRHSSRAIHGSFFTVSDDDVTHASRSRAFTTPPPGYDTVLWTLAARENQGLEDFTGREIVSRQPAKPYALLPGMTGLAKLLKDGALEEVKGGSGQVFAVKKALPAYPYGIPGSLWPYVLLMPADIPLPQGDPGNLCILSHETGRELAGACGSASAREIVDRIQGRTAASSACKLPSPAASEKIIFLGIYSGAMMPNYTLAGNDLTRAAGIKVGAGGPPLYIVAATDRPTIWRLLGDTARVSRLVLAGRGSPQVVAGAAGIDGTRVQYLDVGCLPEEYYNPGSVGLMGAGGSIGAMAGQAPDTVVASRAPGYWFEINGSGAQHIPAPELGKPGPHGFYQLDIATLPLEPPPGYGRAAWISILMQAPGGLADLSKEKIVSAVPVARRGGNTGDAPHAITEDMLGAVMDPAGLGSLGSAGSIAGTLSAIGAAFIIPVMIYLFIVVLFKASYMARKMQTGYLRTVFWMTAAEAVSFTSGCSVLAGGALLSWPAMTSLAQAGGMISLCAGLFGLVLSVAAASRVSAFLEKKILPRILGGSNPQSVEQALKRTSRIAIAVPAILALAYAVLLYHASMRDAGKPVPTFNAIVTTSATPGPDLPQHAPLPDNAGQATALPLPDGTLPAAERGDMPAQYRLGMFLMQKGDAAEKAAGFGWIEKAAEGGYAPAQSGLAFHMEEQKEAPETIAKWLKKAAAQDDFWAQLKLAQAYWHGRGVDKDREEAYFWASLASVSSARAAAADDDAGLRWDPLESTCRHASLSIL